MPPPGPNLPPATPPELTHASRSGHRPAHMGPTILWSKNGFIAYKSPSYSAKANLFLTYLESVDGQLWQLAAPQPISVRPAEDSGPVPAITLVQWSNLSTDLAVCDVHGNFYILLAGVGLLQTRDPQGSAPASPSYELTSYNHMEMIFRDPSSGNDRLTAFRWLNIDKPQIVNRPAALVESQPKSQPLAYNYGVTQYQPPGPTHPILTKQACVSVSRNGVFTLYYQGEHKVEYRKTSVALLGALVAYTKASIGFSEKTIIVAAYDIISGLITIHSISVDWGFLVESAAKQKTDPHHHTPLEAQTHPILSPSSVHVTRPSFSAPRKDPDAMDVDGQRSAAYSLVSIDLVLASCEKESALDVLFSYDVDGNTTIFRYRLADASEVVSEAFTELGARKGASHNAKKELVLVLQDKLTRSGRLHAIETAVADSFLTIKYDDGSVDVVERSSMAVVSDRPQELANPKTIGSLFDIGFRFPTVTKKTGNPLLMAISPNLTAVAYSELNSPLQRLTLAVVSKSTETEVSPKELFVTSVGFAYRHAYACYTNSTSDDLVVLIQTEVRRIYRSLQKVMAAKPHCVDLIVNRFIESIVCESHKAINFQLDAFGKESVDKLLLNPPLQKLLLLQLALGELQTTSRVVSDVAWIVLNLRSTSFGIMFLLLSIYRQISKKKPAEDLLQDSITRGECIMSLIGNVKWLIDLMVYLNQELLQLSFSKQDPGKSRLTLKNLVALPIILSKVPRLFLMYALSSIGKTHEILKKLHKDLSESNKVFTPMKEALNRYFTVCNTLPLNLSIFENFLRECDAYVSKEVASKAGNKEKGYALKVEQTLVCQGDISDDMLPIANTIVERHLANVSRDLKISDLYFYNVDWIEVGVLRHALSPSVSQTVLHDKNALQPFVPRLKCSENETVDALRKLVIHVEDVTASSARKMASKGATLTDQLRKCTRCRSVSLVSDPLVFDAPSTIGLWTMVFQRTCICGSVWVSCQQTQTA